MNLKKKKTVLPLDGWPAWFDGKSINEALFCQHFLKTHAIIYTENAFFTPEGCMMDDAPLKADIYAMLEDYASTSVTKKISSIIELLKITAHVDELAPQTDRIHLANGTLFLDGRFTHEKNEIVRSRFPVRYTPDAAPPAVLAAFPRRAAVCRGYPLLAGVHRILSDSKQQGTADDAHQGQRRRNRKSSATRLIRSMLLTLLRVASGRISLLSLKAKKDKRSLKHGNVSRTRRTWNRKIS